MLGPKVDLTIWYNKGSCSIANKATRIEASKVMGMRTHSSLVSSTIVRVAAKATSMKARERKSKERPIIIFLGKE